MRILLLGNSYTSSNNMPEMLSKILNCYVAAHTRGGARLSEHLNSNTKMGAKTLKALYEEEWDYVVLQEMSTGTFTAKKSFMSSVSKLCGIIKNNRAVPILYATWAYKDNSEKLRKTGYSYKEMYLKIYNSYHEAAQTNSILVADVGKKFYEVCEYDNLYSDDGSHPNIKGSEIAAKTISEVILNDRKKLFERR